MFARWKFQIALIAVIAVFAALTGAFWDQPVAYTQGENTDYVDVGLILDVPDSISTITRDLNIIVMNHGSRTAYDVEVVVELVYPEDSSFFTVAPEVPVGNASLESAKKSLRWTIPALGGLQREEVTADVTHRTTSAPIFNKVSYVHEFFGEVTALSSFESDLHQGNNTDRVWSMSTHPSTGATERAWSTYSVNVSVSNHNPSPGDIVDFIITANDHSDTAVIDQRVAIELTDGLAEAGTATISYAPSQRSGSASYSDGVFNIGTLEWSSVGRISDSVTLPIRVSSDAIVNEQCLTATGNPPPGTGPQDDDISDNVAKV